MNANRRWGLLVSLALLAACGATMRPFTTRPILWKDDDQSPFEPKPEVYYSPLGWNGADKTLFMPVTDTLSVKVGRESIDVNAVDEVPDSSWYTNRLSRTTMTPEEMARGPCTSTPADQDLPWTVTGAKIEGQTPGFTIRTAAGVRYFLKFDDQAQPERASAADVIGSKIYFAAGFTAPCNRVVFFEAKDMLVPPPTAAQAGKKPVTREKVDEVLKLVPRAADGRYRALATQLLAGEPLGPWKYEGVRPDDPNDVVPHEDRREVRATRVLAAWLNHYDTGENNTLSMWIPVPSEGGYVRHDTLDWGDSLGFLWALDELSKRLGYTYYFDFGVIGREFFTFGAVERPWERAHVGKAGKTLGYFDDTDFDPEDWHPGYPNPAFSRMTERDAAWMTRLVARFSDAHLRAIVGAAKFSQPIVVEEAVRILAGRRDRILARWLARLSSLTDVAIDLDAGVPELCMRDRAEEAGWAPPAVSARLWLSRATGLSLPLSHRTDGRWCLSLPPSASGYLLVDVTTGRAGQYPLRIHLAGRPVPAVIGLERPDSDRPPDAVPTG